MISNAQLHFHDLRAAAGGNSCVFFWGIQVESTGECARSGIALLHKFFSCCRLLPRE